MYEANARVKDPVYGCVASIAFLQSQVSQLQSELAMALAETITLRAQLSQALSTLASPNNTQMIEDPCVISSMPGHAQSDETIISSPHLEIEYYNKLF